MGLLPAVLGAPDLARRRRRGGSPHAALLVRPDTPAAPVAVGRGAIADTDTRHKAQGGGATARHTPRPAPDTAPFARHAADCTLLERARDRESMRARFRSVSVMRSVELDWHRSFAGCDEVEVQLESATPGGGGVSRRGATPPMGGPWARLRTGLRTDSSTTGAPLPT